MIMMNADYEERSKNYGFASPSDILNALSRTDTVVLDVRSEDEIAASGNVAAHTAAQWKQTGCTPHSCPQLEANPSDLVREDQKEAPVVIYCRSGRRAVKAHQLLEEYGCKLVMNAGGYDDVMAMLAWQQETNNQAVAVEAS